MQAWTSMPGWPPSGGSGWWPWCTSRGRSAPSSAPGSRAALAAAYGHDVHLNVVLDPQVIGGMSIQIGDELIDGSLATRLAGLRRRLAA